MSLYQGYLPEGPQRPTTSALEAFLASARSANPSAQIGKDVLVRWIGLDAPTTRQIFDLIAARDKTGTFTLPWIVARTGEPTPRAGLDIVLIDFDGTPRLLVRLTKVHETRFGDITAADIAVDGSPVRDLAVWKPMHTVYWNALLKPFGLSVSEAMPVWVEAFEVLHSNS